MVTVTKDYEVCYAHRLLNHNGKCQRLHGHNGKVAVSLEGAINKDNRAPDHGMVLDFGEIDNHIGRWINDTFDHRTILEADDPLICALLDYYEEKSLVVISQPPTAEVLSTLIHQKVIEFYGEYISHCSVRYWETPKACAYVDDSSQDNEYSLPVEVLF